jgi:hypothetical protein
MQTNPTIEYVSESHVARYSTRNSSGCKYAHPNIPKSQKARKAKPIRINDESEAARSQR